MGEGGRERGERERERERGLDCDVGCASWQAGGLCELAGGLHTVNRNLTLTGRGKLA